MTFPDDRTVSLLEHVRAEWPPDAASVEADVRAWREGGELYETGDDDELLHAAELMARAVRHHLHGDGVLREDDLAVTMHSLLFAASTPTSDGAAFSQPACRLARLTLAVIAQRGWQPPHLGGDGHIPAEIFEDADVRRLLAAALPPHADVTALFLERGVH